MSEKLEKKTAINARKLQERYDSEIADFVRASMTTAQGRTFFYTVMENAGLFGDPFSGNALQTAYNCGMQRAAKDIQVLLLEHSPKQFLEMLREKKEEKTNVNSSSYAPTSLDAIGDAASGASADDSDPITERYSAGPLE